MGNSHRRGSCWGTLRGFVYWEFFERQMKVGSGNRVSGTCFKDQGSHDLASEYGARRACFKA